MSSYFDEQMKRQDERVASETRRRPAREGSSRMRTDAAGAFAYGLTDTVTFGYLDEMGAGLDSIVRGIPYEEALRHNREIMDNAQEDHFGWYTTGQVAGALAPFGITAKAGAGLRAGRSVLRAGGSMRAARAASLAPLALTGAAEGALYGSGSADGDLMDPMGGAGLGAALGAAGGYVLGGVIAPAARAGSRRVAAYFRQGSDPGLIPTTNRAAGLGDDGAEAATGSRTLSPDAPPATAGRVNAITGAADDVLEDGALVSLRELLGDPGAARAALTQRIGRLSAAEAESIARRLDQAELNGSVIDDPHFRSLLGMDLSDQQITSATGMNAVELLEEAAEMIRKKAGTSAAAPLDSINDAVTRQLREGLVMDDLQAAFEESRKSVINSRLAQHAIMLAGVQFVRAKDKFLPRILRGDTSAREELAEVLSKSAHILAYAQGTVGNAGRALGALRNPGKLLVDDVSDDLIEIPTLDQLRARVDGAIRHLSDGDLKDLLGSLRTASDISKIEEVLLDAQRAKDFSAWRRTTNSVSMFLKSNALTPATGIFNAISVVGHDLFRNGIARRLAARSFAKAHKADESLALRFELAAARRVYWTAHREGLAAMTARIKWEAWSAVENIAAVGWGRGSVASKARLKQATMLENGYRPPDLREFEAKPRMVFTNLEAFETKQAERLSGGALGNLAYHAAKAGAVVANTLDALGGASMKLFTGALDDWGREFIRLKETYALTARHAIREALDLDLPPDQMLAHAQRRAEELAELPPSDILDRVEAKLLKGEELDADDAFVLRRDQEVDLEADRTLFMDGPQTGFGQLSAKFAAGIDLAAGLGQVEGILLPYIRTPIRLFERGLVSYTPWGKASKEVADALARGGPEAEIVKAQMEAGMMGIKLGMLLGVSGGLTLTNGGWNNSANLDSGPPNRLNFPGGAYVEMGRLDPFSLTLALGGFLGQSVRDGYRQGTEYDAETGFTAALQTAWLSIRDSVLEKSYLTGLRDVMQILFAKEEGDAAGRLDKLAQGVTSRLIPASGTSRLVTDSARSATGAGAPEAIGWVDTILRAIPGGGLHMSERIDPLGNVVDGRKLGIAIGSSNTDPVTEKLRDMGIDIQTLRKADPRGFALTSAELSGLRRIRGNEAQNSQGWTMKQALAELFADPYFQSLPELEQRRQMVIETMAEFNEPARAIMEEKGGKYAANREGYQAFKDYLDQGLPEKEAKDRARQDVASFGLTSPDL
ncbi:MAG TPA: hypothetical protein VGA98_11310 [Allosphingosinicella sp.]|jgi:hypothetical protein